MPDIDSTGDFRRGGRPGSRRAPLLRRVIPGAYFHLAGGRRALVRTYGVAVAIRLVLMPIACHADLLSSYHRSYLLLGDFIPRWWLPHELIQTAFLSLYSLVLPLDELLGWEGSPTVSNDFWLGLFATHSLALPALFLFKLPYLLADIAVSLALLRLYEDSPAKGLRAISLWLFNPITVFSFYVFARHDAIAIAFFAFAMLALDRQHSLRAAFAFGLAIWSRYYGFMLLPFLVVLHSGNWRRKTSLIAVALLPMAGYNLMTSMWEKIPKLQSLSMLTHSGFSDYLLDCTVEMGSNHVLYLFPLCYALLFMFAAAAPDRRPLVLRFSTYATCALLVLYATAFFHPHYMTWMILFLVIVRVGERGRVLSYLHYAQILLFVPYTFYWGKPLYGWLFAPLWPEFFVHIDAPWDWIEPHGDPKIVLNVFRSAMTSVCGCMVAWLLFGPSNGRGVAAPPVAAGSGAPSPVGTAG